MRRLALPAGQYKDHLEQALMLSERIAYSDAVADACQVANDYIVKAPNLQFIQTRIMLPAVRGFFLDLYSRRRKAIVAIKKNVWDILTDATVARCQYCGIGSSETLDHYLEKSRVPELSLFVCNLVPCCWRCNHGRGRTFELDGSRRILHFYYDSVGGMPDVLVATISMSAGLPDPVYSVIPCFHPLVDVYRRHFVALGLRERYESEARALLPSTRDFILNWPCRSSVDVGTVLARQAVSENRRFGPNSHVAALYRALAANPQALAWLTTP